MLDELGRWLNTSVGLHYSMDDEKVYLEMVTAYVQQPKLDLLKKQYETEDWEHYRITVHSVRSTSLSVGACELSQRAGELEQAAREGDVDFLRKHHAAFMEEFHILLEQLMAVISDLEEYLQQDLTGELKKAEIRPQGDVDITGARILVVDDTDMYLQLMEKILSDYFQVICTTSGQKALEIMDESDIDLVLLDVHMPQISGMDLLSVIREKDRFSHIPVILLTADTDQETEQIGFSRGATDFIRKPYNPVIVMQRIRRVLEMSYLQRFLRQEVEKQTKTAEERRLRVETMSKQLMEALTSSIDAKDPYTNGHSSRVAKYSVMIAEKMGYDEEQINQVHYTALLHDVGKIGIPDAIINKTSGLTEEEYEVVKAHPLIGARILSNITEIPNIELGARWHHERYDGTGYPDRLKGDEIPEIAKIIGVADTYDAMASKRSYRDVLPQAVVREEIVKGVGTQFDPRIAEVMLELIDADTDYKMQE